MIKDIYLSYLRAGADIIITASYKVCEAEGPVCWCGVLCAGVGVLSAGVGCCVLVWECLVLVWGTVCLCGVLCASVGCLVLM